MSGASLPHHQPLVEGGNVTVEGASDGAMEDVAELVVAEDTMQSARKR
jgi:hypothetical protein